MSEILTRDETADRLQINTRTLDNWVKRGIVPCLRGGRIVRFDWEKVLQALEKPADTSRDN